jgi:hypothetical protein
MNENDQITRIDGLINSIEGGNEYSEEFFATVSHTNIIPTFPAGFNREDFREEGVYTPDPCKVISATNVIGNTAEIWSVKAGAGGMEYDGGGGTGFQEVLAEVPFQNNGFTLHLRTPPNRVLIPLSGEIPTGVTLSDNAVRTAETIFDAYNSAGDDIARFAFADFNWNEPPNVRNEENQAFWLYADRSVTMRGEVRGYDEWGSTEYIDISNFNVDLQRGWNVVYRRTTRTTTGNVRTQTTTFTHQRPVGVNLSWRIGQWGMDIPTPGEPEPGTRSATNAGRQSLFLRGR